MFKNPFKKEENEIIEPSIRERMELIDLLNEQLQNEELSDEEREAISDEMKHNAAVIIQKGKDVTVRLVKIGVIVTLVFAAGLTAVVVLSRNEESEESEEDDGNEETDEDEENNEETQ